VSAVAVSLSDNPPAEQTAVQRARIVAATAELVGERGFGGVSPRSLIARAKVSPRTFYELFDGLPDCFLAVIDDGADRACALLRDSFERESSWREGLRSALAALLVLLDTEPLVARVWLVEVLGAGSWALERRERHLSRITSLIVSAWSTPAGWQPPPLAAESVMASLLGVLQHHALTGNPAEPHISLLGPLMGVVMRPYLDPDEVTREIERGHALALEIQTGHRPSSLLPLPPHTLAPAGIPAPLTNPAAHRARSCLLYIARRPGQSNRQIATGIGIQHQGHVSTLLARLASLNLLAKHTGPPGHPNAWRLTPAGEHVAKSLTEHLVAASGHEHPDP
jgi:AcrR family transcriptional regulator